MVIPQMSWPPEINLTILQLNNTMWHSFNGNIIRVDEPVISTQSRGLMYGDGCFETFASYGGYVFRLQQHIARLQKACEYLSLKSVKAVEIDYLQSILLQLLQRNKLTKKKAWFRMQVWRRGSRGYNIDGGQQSNWNIQCGELTGSDNKEALKLATVSVRRIPSAALSSEFKLTNGLNYIKAAEEAKNKNADQALMLTVDGRVSETTVANIFWFKDNTLYTPDRNCDLLPGITREFVMETVKKKMGIPVVEGSFSRDELLDADFVFICNSLRDLKLVKEIDGYIFSTDNNYFDSLLEHYEIEKKNNLERLVS